MNEVSPLGDDEDPNPSKGNINTTLTGVAKTLLIPLAARAWDARSPYPLQGDDLAAATLAQLSYDPDELPLTPYECRVLIVRTLSYDRLVSSFLRRYPNAMVVQLGCGLDSRARRLAVDDALLWVDVDLPEVVELRHQVMLNGSAGSAYKLVAADITVPGWFEGLPRDRPTAVVMKGFLSYLDEADVRGLLTQLVDYFDQGETFFECLSPAIVARLQHGDLQAYRKTEVNLKFTLDDVSQFEKMKDGLKVIEAVSIFSVPDVVKLPWADRLRMYLASWVPTARDASRLVRLGWGHGVPNLDA